jgi:hypothetical protein
MPKTVSSPGQDPDEVNAGLQRCLPGSTMLLFKISYAWRSSRIWFMFTLLLKPKIPLTTNPQTISANPPSNPGTITFYRMVTATS